jgi:hypothetical protein
VDVFPFIRKVFLESDLKAVLIKYKGYKANIGRRRQIVTNSETVVLKTNSDTAKVRLGTHLLESWEIRVSSRVYWIQNYRRLE